MKWYTDEYGRAPFALTFDDVLIRPAYSELNSRQDPEYLDRYFGVLLAPIMAANMKTIATAAMANALWGLGIPVPSHRFQTIGEQMAFHRLTRK